MPGPLFFVDRSLGRIRVPRLLRDAGWSLLTLGEHYGIPQDEAVADVEWLQLAGERGWPVLMKDEKIRYREAERRALLAHGVRAFCLTSGNLTSPQMAECFVEHQRSIWAEAIATGPALFAVSRAGMRVVDLEE